MEDFFSFISTVVIFYFLGSCAQSCINNSTKERIINDKGFCVSASAAGQKFEKCYDVMEHNQVK